MVSATPKDSGLSTRYSSPTANLAFEIYREFINRTSHALTDVLGRTGAEEALRQEWEHIGYAVPLNVIKRMELTEKGFVVAGYANNWADLLFLSDQRTELTAYGTRARVITCPFSEGSSAFCAAHLHISVPKLCEFLAPDHEAISRKCLADGDDHCEILIKARSIDPDDLWRVPSIGSILPPPIDEEERILWSHSYFGGCWITQIKAMSQALSAEETLERLRPLMRQTGIDLAPKVRRALDIEVDDLRSVANGLDTLNSAFLKKGSLVDGTPPGIDRRTTTCPMSGEPSEVCLLFQSFYEGLVTGLNPDLELEYSSRMSEGREFCQWTLRNKREKEAKPTRDVAAFDPFAALSQRYINGEISDEEYERKMAMLKKHHPLR